MLSSLIVSIVEIPNFLNNKLYISSFATKILFSILERYEGEQTPCDKASNDISNSFHCFLINNPL